jgi:GT2 family glycosyltransferase
VDRFAQHRGWVRLLENPRRRASAAFNVGVREAHGDVVCLFSAHGVPEPTYVESSVRVLEASGAAGVGGRYVHEGENPVAAAIGLAMTSPFGMASPHRYAHAPREVDTISHPAYRRSVLLEVGAFDEDLMRNSDYEMNWRLREAGHRLVLDPAIGSVYRPRPSLFALGRQFWWYGRWKARVVARHPSSVEIRHLVAPAAVAATAVSPVMALGRTGRRLTGTAALTYALLLFVAVVRAKPHRHSADVRTLAAAFPVMHATWGAGFLVSVFEDLLRRRPHP